MTSDPTWSIDGTQLTIAHPGAPTLHLQADATLPAPTADVPTLPGASWRLVAVTADGVAHRVFGSPSLQLKGGKLLASDGCNTLSGEATVSGGTLIAPRLASTEIGCTSQIGYTAFAVDAVLAGRPTWSIRGSRLTLHKAGAGTLGYQWVPADHKATDPGALTNREWVLASIAGVPARALGSLGVDARGPASGTDGCTDLDATAEIGPGTLTLTGIPTAPPAVCTGAAAEQAATIDSILNQKPALWSVHGNRLIIYGGGPQALSLVYETGPPPPRFPSSAPDPSVLGGRTWKITSIETTGSDSGSSQSSSGITLTFDKNGGYRLTSRCGGQDGKVVLGRGTATFSQGRPEGGNYCVLPDLTRAATTLVGTVAWRIDNGELRLTKGTTALVFAPS